MKKIYYFHDSEGITNDSVEEDITFLYDEVRCLYNQLYFHALTDEQFNIVLALGSGLNAGDNRPA